MLLASQTGLLLKDTVPSVFMVLALELYIESLFIQQRYRVAQVLRAGNQLVSAGAICSLRFKDLVAANTLRFVKDLAGNTFVLSYAAPYSFYRNKDRESSYAQQLFACFVGAGICSLTYLLRGGGASKITFAAYLLFFYKLHQEEVEKLDRNNEVLVIQVALLLCISEINQHCERQRLSISILA